MIGTVPTPKDVKRTALLVLAGIAGVALVLAVLILGGYVWWLSHQASKVPDLRAAAATAQANASSANAGAANASTTRAAIDAGTVTVRLQTEDSARRIENHEQDPDGNADAEPDADIVRELEDAEDRARAAANRLQRTKHR